MKEILFIILLGVAAGLMCVVIADRNNVNSGKSFVMGMATYSCAKTNELIRE